MSPNWIIQECEHCSTKVSGKSRFCPECKTAEGRRQMDADNIKHFEENGLKYNCEYCDNQAKRREEKAERDKFVEIQY